MAVTYTNTWKNILVALKSKIKAEMKCPVLSGFDEKNNSRLDYRSVVMTTLSNAAQKTQKRTPKKTYRVIHQLNV